MKRIPILDITAIPEGDYCYKYANSGVKRIYCPYYGVNKNMQEQENGYCVLTGIVDWEDGTLLWDQVKECGF